MKNYRYSDFALNKFSKGIVYKFADEVFEITMEDFLRETPGATTEDFLKWKELSDIDYEEQSRKENTQTKKNVSISLLEDTSLCCVSSPEEDYIVKEDRKKSRSIINVFFAENKLTEKQKQRFILQYCNGLTFREIAKRESVHFTSVRDSIEQVTQKFREFYLKRI